MPHRKLVKIGESPKLPTIQEFFKQMADRQHEEIRKLKSEIAGYPPDDQAISRPQDQRTPVPDPWLLHPVRVKRAPAKKSGAAAKKRASRGARPATKKSAAKKARTAVKKTARGPAKKGKKR